MAARFSPPTWTLPVETLTTVFWAVRPLAPALPLVELAPDVAPWAGMAALAPLRLVATPVSKTAPSATFPDVADAAPLPVVVPETCPLARTVWLFDPLEAASPEVEASRGAGAVAGRLVDA